MARTPSLQPAASIFLTDGDAVAWERPCFTVKSEISFREDTPPLSGRQAQATTRSKLWAPFNSSAPKDKLPRLFLCWNLPVPFHNTSGHRGYARGQYR
jgi:hypothetical protein